MLTHWLTLHACAVVLDRELAGCRITSAWTQERDELTVALELRGEPRYLHVSCATGATHALMKRDVARARRNTVDVLSESLNARITTVRIARLERDLRIRFDDGRALILQLRGRNANVLLVDATGEAVQRFRSLPDPGPERSDSRDEEWWTLELPGLPLDRKELTSGSGSMPVRSWIRAQRPWATGRFAAELMYRARIDGDTPCSGLDDAECDRLGHVWDALMDESVTSPWHVQIDGGFPALFSPFRLTHLGSVRWTEFEDLHEALWYTVRGGARGGRLQAVRARVLRACAREESRLTRLLERIEGPVELRRRADEYEKYGNLLMINATRHPEQPERMTVPDLFTDPRLVVSIPIDQSLTVIENAERYFDKARASRDAAVHGAARLDSAAASLASLRAFRTSVEEASGMDDLTELFTNNTERMAALGLTPKGETDDRPFPFRKFIVSGGFEVWAGRNSANNDELTVRWARPNDLWFHARGVGGSHVIIRVASAPGAPSKDAIREAAAIAAWYSKHRNARSVPVAYTEKKYVRKPRGVPAGTVILEREKVIMVTPALPAGAESDDTP